MLPWNFRIVSKTCLCLYDNLLFLQQTHLNIRKRENVPVTANSKKYAETFCTSFFLCSSKQAMFTQPTSSKAYAPKHLPFTLAASPDVIEEIASPCKYCM